jgi:hypothetical protein
LDKYWLINTGFKEIINIRGNVWFLGTSW